MLLAMAPAAAHPIQSAPHPYDIPAQPLSSALARFAEASGVDVLLDEPQAAGQRSSPVQGTFSTPHALTLLLRGTGLVARFTSPNSAVIVPLARAAAPLPRRPGETTPTIALDMLRVTAPRFIGGTRVGDAAYLQNLAGEIRRVIQESDEATPRSGRIRLRLQTSVDPGGTLHGVRVVTTSGDAARDQRILRLLEGRPLSARPPAGLRQPLLFDLVAQ